MPRKKATALKGTLSLLDSNQRSFTNKQIELLVAIREYGSITAAAKQVGISYKTAWDRIDALNNLSDKALVARTAGGATGGGTKLTSFGEEILKGFSRLQQEHDTYVRRLGTSLHSVKDLSSFLRSTTLHTSARNQFRGQIEAITRGEVNTEVEIKISKATHIVAQVTNESAKNMKFSKGKYAIALIKSSWIILSKELEVATSARNKLIGVVTKITKGKVNSEINIDLGDGKTLCSMITNRSSKLLKIKKGDRICALFKASSVILMAD